MKKLNVKYIWMITLFLSFSAKSQEIVYKSVYEKFSAGIVAKVYQYTRKTKLTEDQQLKLATRLQLIDSVLVEYLKKGKTPLDTDSTYATAYADIYADTYLDKIRAIKNVPESLLQKIKKRFISKSEKEIYADWATVILEATQSTLPDTSIFSGLYKQQIIKQSVVLSAVERVNLIMVHHISKEEFSPIIKLVEKKSFHQALIEYTYAGYPRKRDSALILSHNYHDSIIKVALLRNGSLMNSSQFAIALKFKKALELRPSLIDTLLTHAMYLSRKKDSIQQKDPFAKADTKTYEAKVLNELLTEEQYTKLLYIKNNSQAKLDAEEDWNEMEKRGVSNGFNKAATITQLYNYYMQKWNAYYRLAHDEIKQEGNLHLLKENAPRQLKVLNAAKKQPNAVNANTNFNLRW